MFCPWCLLFFDYITKIVISVESAVSPALEECRLVVHVSGVELPDCPPEQVGVILVPFHNEIPEIPVTGVEEFALVFVVEEFCVVLLLGDIFPIPSFHMTKIRKKSPSDRGTAPAGQPRLWDKENPPPF